MTDSDDPRLTAYVLGELDEPDRRALESALATDPDLAGEVIQLRATADQIASALTRDPAPGLTVEQRASLAASRSIGWGRPLFVILRAAAMAAVMLLPLWVCVPAVDVRSARPDRGPLATRATPPAPPSPRPPSPSLAAPPLLADPSNPWVIRAPAASGEDLSAMQFALAPGGPRYVNARPAASSLSGDIQRNVVNYKGPYHDARSAAGRIQDWVRGSSTATGSQLRSHNDYYYNYSGGYPAAYDPAAYAPVNTHALSPSSTGSGMVGATIHAPAEADVATLNAQVRDAFNRYVMAESRQDVAGASQALRDYSRLKQVLSAARNGQTIVSVENPFQRASEQALSTFGIDVDTASYSKVRRYLESGQRPPPSEVRLEELVNYFPYSDPGPDPGEPLTVTAEVAGCPWAPEHRLVRLALRAKTVPAAERPVSNLVFLVDVSGSMEPEDRLPLVKRALKMLVEQLRDEDRVALVTYAGESGLALDSTPVAQKARILAAIERLEAGGSTNGSGGIQLAYRVASRSFVRGGNNRVIMATDGDFNVGVTSGEALEELIRARAQSGVFLSVLGVGMGDHRDATLERLADRGNGNHAYLDSLAEARKVLVEQAGGTLLTVARDVKVQVRFDPARVARWRQLGYENRALAARDFADDSKDGGELGAGQSVTAFYEIEPAKTSPAPVLTVQVRFQEPAGSPSRLLTFPVIDRGTAFERAGDDFRFGAAVAAFGMLLKGSPYRGNATLDDVRRIATGACGDDPHGHRAQLLALLDRAERGLR